MGGAPGFRQQLTGNLKICLCPQQSEKQGSAKSCPFLQNTLFNLMHLIKRQQLGGWEEIKINSELMAREGNWEDMWEGGEGDGILGN